MRAIAKETGIARAPSIACSSSSDCNLTAPAASYFRPIPSLSRSCATWSLAHSLHAIADLVKKIDRFIRTHYANSRPFVASRQRSIRSRWELVNAPVPTTNNAPALRSMTFATSRGRRHGEAEHAGGLMVDDQLELGRLPDRQIGRLGT